MSPAAVEGPPSEPHRPQAAEEAPAAPADPELEHTKREVEELLKAIEQKEETIYKEALALNTHPTKPQVQPRSDMSTKTLKELQDMKEQLEKELQVLEEKETALENEKIKLSKYGRSNAIVRNPNQVSRAGQPLSLEERELLNDFEVLVGQEFDWGLQWERKWQDQAMGPPEEHVRRKIREGTKKKVEKELGLTYFGETALNATVLQASPFPSWTKGIVVFLDQSPRAKREPGARAGGAYLLGRYDIVVAKAAADFDRNWSFMSGRKKDFWVAHAAALNIGESLTASDFDDFELQEKSSSERKLDEESYYEAMEQILANVVFACEQLSVRHLVFFPFGMGAFLRHLGQIDRKFVHAEEVQRLRRRLANCFVSVLAKLAPSSMSIHLCLMFAEEEPRCNADAFLRALSSDNKDAAVLRPRVIIHPEGDSLNLASDLAEASHDVLLLNGANRMLLGNHWFAGRAKLAMDENLHRRSWRMAATSYLLNGYAGHEPFDRHADDLKNHVKLLGGKAIPITRSKSWLG